MKTKIKQSTIICGFCDEVVSVKDAMKIKTDIEEYFYCSHCLLKSFHRLDKMKHKDKDTLKLMLEIKSFLKNKNKLKWQN